MGWHRFKIQIRVSIIMPKKPHRLQKVCQSLTRLSMSLEGPSLVLIGKFKWLWSPTWQTCGFGIHLPPLHSRTPPCQGRSSPVSSASVAGQGSHRWGCRSPHCRSTSHFEHAPQSHMPQKLAGRCQQHPCETRNMTNDSGNNLRSMVKMV